MRQERPARAYQRGVADPAPFGCSAGHLHRFEIPGGAGRTVIGLALRCPECSWPSAAQELTEIVAARRRTIDGLAGLPAALRADLTSSGTLAGVYRGTVVQVLQAAEHCRTELGVEPPTGLRDRPAGPSGSQPFAPERATAVLDAASEWLAGWPHRRPN